MKKRNEKIRFPNYDLREEIERGLEYMAQHEEVLIVRFERQLVSHQRPESIDVKRVSYAGRAIDVYLYVKDSRLGRGIGCAAKLIYKGTKATGKRIVEALRKYTSKKAIQITCLLP